MRDINNKHWTELKGSEKHDLAYENAEKCYNLFSTVRQKFKRNLYRYLGLNQMGIMDGTSNLPYANLTKSYIDSIVARVASISKPKIQITTTDADWSVIQKGKKLDRFLTALLEQPTAGYPNVHSMVEDLVRDAGIFGFGVAQIIADIDYGRVITERILPHEVCWDPNDARYNNPQEFYRVYLVSKKALADAYPEKEKAIEAANNSSYDDIKISLLTQTPTISNDVIYTDDYVMVTEVWRLAFSSDKPGQHLILIQSGSEVVALQDESWELTTPPFAFIWYNKPVMFNNIMSLADENQVIEDEINILLTRIQETIDRTAISVLLSPEGSVDEEKMEKTIDATVIQYNAQIGIPQYIAPVPVSQYHLQHLEYLKNMNQELRGVSQLAISGERQPGLNSGAAIRAANNVQSIRFAQLWNQVERFVVSWSRLVISSVRTLSDDYPDFASKWSGGKFLKSIKWSEVDIDDDQFDLSINPVSDLKDTPADKLAKTEELLSKGLLTPEQYNYIISTTIDIESESGSFSREKELCEKYIINWLDATKEQIDSGFIDYDKDEPTIPLIPSVNKWFNLGAMLLTISDAYCKAELDGAPDNVKELFLDYMSRLQQTMDDLQMKQMQMQASAQMAAKGQQPIAPEEMQAPAPAIQQ